MILEVLNCIVGHTKTGFCKVAKVWGENHLWVGFRQESNSSGLVEPEIHSSDARRIHVVNGVGYVKKSWMPTIPLSSQR